MLTGLAGSAAGAGVVGLAAGQASPGDATAVQPAWGAWFTDGAATGPAVGNYDGTTEDRRGEDEVTVEVGAQGNGGPFAFSPPALWISEGTTVHFEWVSDTHNVIVDAQPADAGWEGHTPIEDTGFSLEHTFETGGIYEYYCEPHLTLGMKAGIAVGDDVPTEAVTQADEPAGDDGFTLPGGAVGGAFIASLFATAGVAVLAVLAGELYRSRRDREAVAVEETPEEPEPLPGVVREIGHDEFEPVGTASLILLYLVILVVMWVFVYFVEFLGRTGTVIG